MTEPAFVYVGPGVVGRVLPDGSSESCADTAAPFAAWLAAGNAAPAPYVAPAPVPTCLLWQLQAVLTAAQWTGVQAAVAAVNSPVLSSFVTHGGNVIPANSTTLIALGAAIGLTPDQVTALVLEASTVSIP
jgi:hypothetical protein